MGRTRVAEECSGRGSGARAQDIAGEDRRSGCDRRSGRDRRGAATAATLSREVRPYRFRDFTERRNPQDRRLYVFPPPSVRPSGGTSRGGAEAAESEMFVQLTREEIRVLLASLDDNRDG